MLNYKYTYHHTENQETRESVTGVIQADTLAEVKGELARRYRIRPNFEVKTIAGYGELHIASVRRVTRKVSKGGERVLIVSASPTISLASRAGGVPADAHAQTETPSPVADTHPLLRPGHPQNPQSETETSASNNQAKVSD